MTRFTSNQGIKFLNDYDTVYNKRNVDYYTHLQTTPPTLRTLRTEP